MLDGLRPFLVVHGQLAQELVVASGDPLEQLPLAVHQRQQVRDVGFRRAAGLVLGFGPVDDGISHKGLDIAALEALRHLLALLDSEQGQFQAVLELNRVEQPDQHLDQDRIRVDQAGGAVALHIVQILGQQFVALQALAFLAAVDRADALQVAIQGGQHQGQVLLRVRWAVQGLARVVGRDGGGISRHALGQNPALVGQGQAHGASSTESDSSAANLPNCSIT